MGRGLSGSSGGGGGNDPFAGETGPQIYASGGRAESNNFTVDDSSANSASRGGYTNINPNADSVEEIRVVANNFSAVDGRNGGAQVQVITRGGGNQFHGGASNYFQNNTLSARNLFEGSVPVSRRNQFGYNIGGPIVRNRIFFFHSYEGLRFSGARAQVFSVETPAFRDFVLSTRPNSIAAKILRDFGPVAYADSGFRDLGSPRPGVNLAGPADGIPDVGTVIFAPAQTRSGNQFNVRGDAELLPGKDRLNVNYYRTWATYNTGTIRPVFDRPRSDTTHFASLNHTHIFSPNFINEARFGFLRTYGLLSDPLHPEIPTITVPQIQGWTLGIFPYGFFQNNYQFKDVLSIIHGGHLLKAGGEIRRGHINTRNTREFVPSYSFASILDFADDEALQMTRTVDPRAGIPATTDIGLRQWEWAGFVQDDWKVNKALSLNIGLRYEHYGPITEIHDQMRSLVFGSGQNYSERFANGRADFVPRLFDPVWNTLAPRLGFAWNPRSKGWVLRGRLRHGVRPDVSHGAGALCFQYSAARVGGARAITRNDVHLQSGRPFQAVPRLPCGPGVAARSGQQERHDWRSRHTGGIRSSTEARANSELVLRDPTRVPARLGGRGQLSRLDGAKSAEHDEPESLPRRHAGWCVQRAERKLWRHRRDGIRLKFDSPRRERITAARIPQWLHAAGRVHDRQDHHRRRRRLPEHQLHRRSGPPS